MSKCSELEHLDLSYNHFEEGSSGLFGALKNSNLKYLNFSKNGINDEAMEALAKGLRGTRLCKDSISAAIASPTRAP
ncbi:hypothetical protein CEXT_618531 [Caerostris extrusa]|uniref:Uncharacterized protein n=1 Tax=Caerostris extrusa TaxID=172846 RepID=A0AAV4P4P4_CAEEX|nr:hypothetical protein CEXT_618531 [Caerostris extrusa]